MYLIHLRDGVNDEAVFNLTKAIEERDEIRYQLKEKIVENDMLKNKIEKHKPKFEEINDEKGFFGVFVSILGAIALGSMIMKD